MGSSISKLVMSLMTVLVVLSGCSGLRLGGEWTPPPVALLTDADEVMTLFDFTIPDGVDNVVLVNNTELSLDPTSLYLYSYTVSWDGSIESTEEFLAQSGRNMQRVYPRDKDDIDFLCPALIVDSVPEGSLGANWAPRSNYSLCILLDGPDWTTVHVSLTKTVR